MRSYMCVPHCLSLSRPQRATGAVFPSPDGSALSYTRNVPVGVVVAVLTWNFPLLNLGYKLGPILATGCTCVIKPAEVRVVDACCCHLFSGQRVPGNQRLRYRVVVDFARTAFSEPGFGPFLNQAGPSTMSVTRMLLSGLSAVLIGALHVFSLTRSLSLSLSLSPPPPGVRVSLLHLQVTPLATSFACQLIEGTGIPAGVVNVVNGTGMALLAPLCSSPIPRLLTTIGSTTMGKRLIAASATTIKKFSLELGGTIEIGIRHIMFGPFPICCHLPPPPPSPCIGG